MVFLADHSKLGLNAAFFFADVENLSCFITDKAADPTFIEQLQGRGVEVLQGD